MRAKERTAGTPSIQTQLSTLWIFIMFNMVFADILSAMYPGVLKAVLTGHAGGVHVTRGFLLGAAVVTEIPIATIVLLRVLKHTANWWANAVAGVITIAYVIGGGSLDLVHELYFAAMEVGCTLIIVWCAWTWRHPARRRFRLPGPTVS